MGFGGSGFKSGGSGNSGGGGGGSFDDSSLSTRVGNREASAVVDNTSLSTRIGNRETTADAVKISLIAAISAIEATTNLPGSALTLEGYIDTEIAVGLVPVISDIADVSAALVTADGSLQTLISDEAANRVAVVSDLKVTVDINTTDVALLDSSLIAEISARTLGDASVYTAAEDYIDGIIGSNAGMITTLQSLITAAQTNPHVALINSVSVETSATTLAFGAYQTATDASIGVLTADITGEITNRIDGVSSIDLRFTSLSAVDGAYVDLADTSLTTRILAEETTRLNKDASLTTAIANINGVTQVYVDQQDQGLNTLITNLDAAYKAQDGILAAEIAGLNAVTLVDVTAIETSLTTAITAEVTTRTNNVASIDLIFAGLTAVDVAYVDAADAVLAGLITAEETARITDITSIDLELGNLVAIEAGERELADASLHNALVSLKLVVDAI